MEVTLWDYATHTRDGLRKHRRFWEVLENALPAELKESIATGELRELWTAKEVGANAVDGDSDVIEVLIAGSEEEGMRGPRIKAPMRDGDSYLLVNDRDQDLEAYDRHGTLLFRIPALARGQGSDRDTRSRGSDTPPGLYKVGRIYQDYVERGADPPYSEELQSYGWYSLDLIELEDQEARNGRAGIMLHGGGSACGWPGAWAPRQELHSTLGCIRCHNVDIRDKIMPLTVHGTVYVAVWQEG